MRKKKVNFNTITIEFGSYTYNDADTHDNVILKTKPVKTINEYEFYYKYLQLKSVVRIIKVDGKEIDISLTKMHLQLMAHIMTKEMDFNVNWKNNCQQIKDLAKELNRTTSSIYKSYVALKKKRYFITTEDKLILPNAEVNKIRNRIKSHIIKNGHATCDINFEFCVG